MRVITFIHRSKTGKGHDPGMRRGEGGRGIVVNMGYGYSKEVGYEQREGDLLIGTCSLLLLRGGKGKCALRSATSVSVERSYQLWLCSLRKTYRC